MKAEKQISSDQKDQRWRRWEEDREEIRVHIADSTPDHVRVT